VCCDETAKQLLARKSREWERVAGSREPAPRGQVKRNRVRLRLDPMKFLITLERDEDGVWVAESPSIPG
jgi:hypothetical protein